METLPYQRFVMTDWHGIFLRMMPTAFGSMRTLGFVPELASLVQWAVSLLAAWLVIWLLWKETDPLRRTFIVTCGTFLITPYAFNYDMGALSAVAAILVVSDRGLSSLAGKLVICVVAALAAVVMSLGEASLPIAPLILAAGLTAIAMDARSSPTSVVLLNS